MEVKVHQLGQLPNLGRDGACQRIFAQKTISGRLVYQTGQDEHNIDVPVSWLRSRSSPVIALQRPSSVGIRPVTQLIERIISRSLLVYQTGLDEHKICVPFSWLNPSLRSLIALQRPSSVGIRPVIKLIERLISRSLLVYPSRNLSTTVLTGQSVLLQLEVLHIRAAPELRRDCTCAARRSF